MRGESNIFFNFMKLQKFESQSILIAEKKTKVFFYHNYKIFQEKNRKKLFSKKIQKISFLIFFFNIMKLQKFISRSNFIVKKNLKKF